MSRTSGVPGATFVAARLLHFPRPGNYQSIMPDFFPVHRERPLDPAWRVASRHAA